MTDRTEPSAPGAASRTRKRWGRLRRRLWQPPRPHGEQPLDRDVSPLELFYDLIVVVLVGRTAEHMTDHLTWRALADFGAVFVLIWIAWLNSSLYHDLHGREDARSRTVLLVQVLALVPVGAFIPRAGHGAAFPISTAVVFAILALIWYLAGRPSGPEYRLPNLAFVAGTAAVAAVLAATAGLSADARVLAWLVLAAAYLTGLGVILAKAPPGLAITPALIHRFGLFIIIVLGETVVGVVDGLAHEPADALTITVGLVAVVIGFGAWWTYFDFAGHRPPRPTRTATVQWIMTHLPLTAAIAAIGAAMPGLVEHAHSARTPPAIAWLLCAATAIVLGATMTVAASLQTWHTKRTLYRLLTAACATVAALCLALAAAHPAPLPLGLALIVLLGTPWTLAVTRRVSNETETHH
ncbi:low temperature requirement protein A [Actinomadura decatromicini]|uniref:Low temperature requirement protein A n=1 Tax=Actinomadura decatromicini TaxID=2604572 RepID=A0A5D3F8G8_9ACTN|nr:low temperature requirement protein A [Actinomadura decatromicini]TYK44126.1 low temperature requirement protein A [Actinomadura decatromicini]